MNADIQYLVLKTWRPKAEKELTEMLGLPVQFESIEDFKRFLMELGKPNNGVKQ